MGTIIDYILCESILDMHKLPRFSIPLFYKHLEAKHLQFVADPDKTKQKYSLFFILKSESKI